jgi:hypothetical protein
MAKAIAMCHIKYIEREKKGREGLLPLGLALEMTKGQIWPLALI